MSNVNLDTFFSAADETQDKVHGGELSVSAGNWPDLKGTCSIIKIEPKRLNGKNVLDVVLKHEKFGRKSFMIFMPAAHYQPIANAIRMKQLYSTIFNVGGADTDKHSVSEAYNMATKNLKNNPDIIYEYVLTEVEKESPKNGKIYTNQDLELLAPAEEKTKSERDNGFSI